MALFPSPQVMHTNLIARMKQREAQKKGFRVVTVSGVIFVTKGELIERGRPVDDGIRSLTKDIKRVLVYVDPAVAREEAKNARELAEDPSQALFSAAFKQIADEKDLDAKICEERMKSISPDLAKRQIDYSDDFFRFSKEWGIFYGEIKAEDPNYDPGDEMSGNALLDKIDLFYTRYKQFYDAFGSISDGGKPDLPPPKPSTAGDTLPNIKDLVDTKLPSIPWDKIFVFGGGALVLWWLVSRRREPSAAPAPIIIGPPQPRTQSEALTLAHR